MESRWKCHKTWCEPVTLIINFFLAKNWFLKECSVCCIYQRGSIETCLRVISRARVKEIHCEMKIQGSNICHQDNSYCLLWLPGTLADEIFISWCLWRRSSRGSSSSCMFKCSIFCVIYFPSRLLNVMMKACIVVTQWDTCQGT